MIIVEYGCSGLPTTRAACTMFEDRKSVFVDLLKWDIPIRDGRFEIDEFDDAFATYIIVIDEAGDHCGSARLLPTTRRHILGELFAGLCEGAPPTGPDIVEITRFCLSRRQAAAERLRTRNELVSALASYALASGIRTYTGVAEIAWLQQVIGFGWDCRPLGTAVETDCGIVGALAIEITAETPNLLMSNGIWQLPETKPLGIARAA